MILDRNGEPLAVSTPVDTVWANPRKLAQRPQDFARLAKALDRDPQWLARRVTSNLDREFVYLVRHMRPQDAAQGEGARHPRRRHAARVPPLLPGGRGHRPPARLHQRRRRRARKGSSSRSTSGSAGEPGSKRVMHDRHGRTIEDIERIKAPRPGQDLRTSIDLRVQYLAYRELKAAVQENEARGGSVVVLDIADRRSAGDGEPAGVQPERPRAVPAVALSQPRDQRLLRARLEHQAVRRRGRHEDRPLPRRHADRHRARHAARRHQDGQGQAQPRHDRRDARCSRSRATSASSRSR